MECDPWLGVGEAGRGRARAKVGVWELNIHGEGTPGIRILDPFIGRSFPLEDPRIGFVRYWPTLAPPEGNEPYVML